MNQMKAPLSPNHLPNRNSTASGGVRNKLGLNNNKNNKNTLPELTKNFDVRQIGSQEMALSPNLPVRSGGPGKIPDAHQGERLIKSSHLKKRSRMVVGEIDDGTNGMQVVPDDSSTMSPILPFANNDNSMLKSHLLGRQRIRSKTLKKPNAGRN